MTKAALFAGILLLLYSRAFSQGGSITGRIFSDSSHQPVESASVTLSNAKDSSIEKIVLSDKKGAFAFNDLKFAGYILSITSLNHRSILELITISEQKREWISNSITMKFAADSLASVTVTTYKQPVIIKEDTTEYNAGSFKTRENALVEDLLKKLPGIEVLKDGSVKANGEKITQILVDGKPFFGDDPKMATENLPASIIDKIQVIDQKSDKAQVTKAEDGIRTKVINITIKKDKNKGYFGRAYAGYGTNGHYEARINTNYFNKSRKITFITGTNNTGRSDYGSSDNDNSYYNNSMGITSNLQTRVNYIDRLSKLVDVNASFGYSDNKTTSEQTRNRQNIFGDSSSYYLESSRNDRNRSGYNMSLGVEYRPDTMTNLRLNESGGFNKSDFLSASSFSSTLQAGKKINDGDRRSTGSTKSPSLNGSLSFSRRFNKKKRALFFNLNHNNNNSVNEGLNASENNFYPENSAYYKRLINQLSNNNNRVTSLSSSVSLSEPLYKQGSLNISVSYNYGKNNSLRQVFNYNNASGYYDILNDTLSNNFNNFNYSKSAGISYTHSLKKGSVAAGITWNDQLNKSVSLSKDSVYQQRFSGTVPYLSFNWNGKGRYINLYYNYNTQAPPAYQLQPVLDNSNPLYLRLGNPNLRYSSTHRINYSFNFFSQKKQNSINLNGNFSLTSNALSTSVIFDKTTGAQVSQPVNVSGVYNGGSNISYNKPIKLLKQKISLNSNANFNFSKNVSLTDNRKNNINSLWLSFSNGFSISLEDWADFRINYNLSVQNSRYSLNPYMNNYTYTNSGSVDAEFRPGKLSEIRVNWDFSSNSGRSVGFNRKINMINADLTQYVNTKKNWWFKIKIYDLLRQNVGISRYNGENYIEDVRMNVLSRFVLVSINMRLNKFQR